MQDCVFLFTVKIALYGAWLGIWMEVFCAILSPIWEHRGLYEWSLDHREHLTRVEWMCMGIFVECFNASWKFWWGPGGLLGYVEYRTARDLGVAVHDAISV